MHLHTGKVDCGVVLNVHISIFLSKEQIKNMSKQHPKLGFTFYHIIGHFTAHGRIQLKDKNICYMCKQESSPDNSTKIYTRKELVMTETTISEFHIRYYNIDIKKLAFQLPHVPKIGTSRCGEMRCTAFK